MDFPKLKILIYTLTFLGYAWSGYGSGLLMNIRDAIILAEDYFGKVLENVVDVVKKFNEGYRILDSSNENCKFSCPSGEIPVKNKRHKPTSNGCGTEFLKFKINEYIPSLDMTECCNQHDICYDTCTNLKQNCDDLFKNCLYKLCENASKLDTLIKACKVAASMVGGSMTLGCKSYLESQKRSCYCPLSEKKKEVYSWWRTLKLKNSFFSCDA